MALLVRGSGSGIGSGKIGAITALLFIVQRKLTSQVSWCTLGLHQKNSWYDLEPVKNWPHNLMSVVLRRRMHCITYWTRIGGKAAFFCKVPHVLSKLAWVWQVISGLRRKADWSRLAQQDSLQHFTDKSYLDFPSIFWLFHVFWFPPRRSHSSLKPPAVQEAHL